MKHKKLILILSLLIISFSYIIHPYMTNKETSVDSFKDEIIRFHIKANSDKEEDQALKLKIRDQILKDVGIQFENSISIEDTRRIVEKNMENIKHIAENVIQKEGKDFPVDVSLGKRNFPTRKYGEVTFPAGEYETLQVTIGEGQGKNWWCVMFPPLCFLDETKETIDTDNVKETIEEYEDEKNLEDEDNSGEELKEEKTEEEIKEEEIIDNERIDDEKKSEGRENKIEFKFKIFDIIKNIFNDDKEK